MKVREFYRLSNKGYFLSLAALIMFALISLLLMSMMPELIRMLNATKESEISIGRYIENRNLDERILAIIDIKPSFEGSYDFGDSYGSVEIIEKNTVLQSITLSDAIFNVDNATDLTVTLTPGPMVTINNAHLYYEGSI